MHSSTKKDSCVIYGMPRAAIQLGVVDKVVSLEAMPQAIMDALVTLPS